MSALLRLVSGVEGLGSGSGLGLVASWLCAIGWSRVGDGVRLRWTSIGASVSAGKMKLGEVGESKGEDV